MSDRESCWMCSSPLGSDGVCGGYRRCRACGHRLSSRPAQFGAVDNDALDLDSARALDALTRAQVRLTLAVAVRRGSLLDIGSGTGKFLHHVRPHFTRVVGLEVSVASVRFARQVLGLPVVTTIAEAGGPLDVVTAWHSLEHISPVALLDVMACLRGNTDGDTRIVICVPNPDAAAARLFGTRWAFRDVESHVHEFSRRSLDELFARFGFRYVRDHNLWVYSCFDWVQSLCNLLPGPHNYLYYRVKRRHVFHANCVRRALADTAATLALLCVAPLGILCTAVERVMSRQTSVHVVTYAGVPKAHP